MPAGPHFEIIRSSSRRRNFHGGVPAIATAAAAGGTHRYRSSMCSALHGEEPTEEQPHDGEVVHQTAEEVRPPRAVIGSNP
ncbi:twin-arginine translocation signal domain-containing protein [Mycobacterium sp. SMC-4]|uniref:twin-arginine translocation signal domain-containing protein n=1 Tax=Mycobacterium sp. SMC-4 TaxID=2857059 RepID=UPI0021FCFE6E|nr:twin-arginine translocation signal domain-containing protein [Mycobacterium sp. SMC-4]